VLTPLLCRAVDEDKKKEAKSLVNYALKLFLVLVIPFIAGSFVLSKPLLTIFANQEVANAAHLIMPIVAIGILFFGLSIILSEVLFVQMKTKIIFIVLAGAALLNLLLNIVFIYMFRNIIIAALTTFVSYFVAFVFLNSKIQKSFRIKYDSIFILKLVCSAVSIGFALKYLSFLSNNTLWMVMALIAIGIVLYFFLLISFRVLGTKELAFAKECISYIKYRKD